jgi:hypothetical protein
VKKGNSAVPQVHVKWQGLPDTATSWEDWYVLKAKFPEAAAWGQAESQAGGGGGGCGSCHVLLWLRAGVHGWEEFRLARLCACIEWQMGRMSRVASGPCLAGEAYVLKHIRLVMKA